MDNFEQYLAEIDRDTLVLAMRSYFEAKRKGCHEDMEQHLAVAENCIKELNEIAAPITIADDIDISALAAIESAVDRDDLDNNNPTQEPKRCS